MGRQAQHDVILGRRGWLRCAGAAVANLYLGHQAFAARRARQVVVNRQQELNLKGVYLYSFCRFVKWPATAFSGPEAPLVIGVLGNQDMRTTLLDVAKKRPTAQGRKLEIRTLVQPDDPNACQSVVITADVKPDQQDAVIKQHVGAPVLIVTESAGMGQKGAHVNFFLEGATVKFEINVPAAQTCQLQFDPQLTALKVARLLGTPEATRPK